MKTRLSTRRFTISRTRKRGALAFLLLALTAPGVLDAQRMELEKFIHYRVLANGLEIIVAENHGVPLVTVEFDVKNGSFTQPAGFEGLAHMYEHMFFKANSQLPLSEQFVQRASELGAVFNGTTQEERVNYYMTLPADSLAAGLQVMVAALRTPLFRREELERERQVVLGEYDRNESSPFFELEKQAGQLLYPGQWSRKNVIGERPLLQSVTPDKMREIQRRYYVPNNSALIVTGDVDPARVFSVAESLLGDWKRSPDPFAAEPIPPIPALDSSSAIFVERPVGAVTVTVQWQGPSVRRDAAATYAADVFSDALNQPGSTLQRRLVDSGLFQSIIVNYYTLDHVGPITISGQTTPDKLKEAIRALNREIEQLADPGYVSQEQLDATKAERAVSTAFGFDRPSDFAHTLGFWWSVAGLEYYMGYVDNMGAQTLDDLRAYAKKYIVGKRRVVALLLPPGTRQTIGLTAADVLARVAP